MIISLEFNGLSFEILHDDNMSIESIIARSQWDVGQVTDMHHMLHSATSFGKNFVGILMGLFALIAL